MYSTSATTTTETLSTITTTTTVPTTTASTEPDNGKITFSQAILSNEFNCPLPASLLEGEGWKKNLGILDKTGYYHPLE